MDKRCWCWWWWWWCYDLTSYLVTDIYVYDVYVYIHVAISIVLYSKVKSIRYSVYSSNKMLNTIDKYKYTCTYLHTVSRCA
ncbi:hypothetical protein BCR39DRAFT_525667 [Naematelia encephala]|uniref:Uncharacterized protein n=1 Tax=Naematelia encephala TaxID=71784 RepID=A0A1Y2BAK3_9TREE|nr:hypothetical protein BCR39DRAFT_525667 [Naematelia encephala]